MSEAATDADGARVQRLEGRLAGQWVRLVDDLVRTELTRCSDDGLVLDLSGLQHASPQGVALLRGLRAAGARLRACPAYLRDLCEEDCR